MNEEYILETFLVIVEVRVEDKYLARRSVLHVGCTMYVRMAVADST